VTKLNELGQNFNQSESVQFVLGRERQKGWKVMDMPKKRPCSLYDSLHKKNNTLWSTTTCNDGSLN